MPAFLDGLFISELLVDNPGSGTNTDGDRSANKSDEFIEIQNASGADIDLSDYQIWSQTNGLLYDFSTAPGSTTIANGGVATVIGEYTGTALPGFYDAGLRNGANFLEDGETAGMNVRADVIYLLNTQTGEYIYLSYGEDPLPVAPPFNASDLPPGVVPVEVGGELIESDGPNGISILRDGEGNLIEGTPTPNTPGTVCFVTGTLVTTDQGDIPVEALKPGMMVLSKDRGFVPLRAIFEATIGRVQLRWFPDVRPVFVPAGAIGNTRPLLLSPAHRILISHPVAEMNFGAQEVLVSARQMVGWAGVKVMLPDRPIGYLHLLFDNHEIIQTEGCWSESLFLGDAAENVIAQQAKWQVEQGLNLDALYHDNTACLVLKKFETVVLLSQMKPIHPEISSVA